jgi:hypothetical protein
VSMLATVYALYSSGIAGILVETEYDFLDFPVGPIIGSFDDVVAVPVDLPGKDRSIQNVRIWPGRSPSKRLTQRLVKV